MGSGGVEAPGEEVTPVALSSKEGVGESNQANGVAVVGGGQETSTGVLGLGNSEGGGGVPAPLLVGVFTGTGAGLAGIGGIPTLLGGVGLLPA